VADKTPPAPETPKPSGKPFDLTMVRDLIRLMARFDLNEIDLHEGDHRIRLRRGLTSVSGAAPVPGGFVAAPAAGPVLASGGPNNAPAAPASKLIEIKSPMVGTFYSKPAPDKDDYVKVGSRVSPDTVVCKIEAMKIFNDLPAGCSGAIAEILVQNEEFVEYDQVLFRVDPS
jgi:acetyl-CoA carboxylase biotin carboxyl carrier protein